MCLTAQEKYDHSQTPFGILWSKSFMTLSKWSNVDFGIVLVSDFLSNPFKSTLDGCNPRMETEQVCYHWKWALLYNLLVYNRTSFQLIHVFSLYSIIWQIVVVFNAMCTTADYKFVSAKGILTAMFCDSMKVWRKDVSTKFWLQPRKRTTAQKDTCWSPENDSSRGRPVLVSYGKANSLISLLAPRLRVEMIQRFGRRMTAINFGCMHDCGL